MVKSCSLDSKPRKSHERKSYAGVKLDKPIKVKSVCVKEFERKLKCKGSQVERKAYEIKTYGGQRLPAPIKVKAACVSKPISCPEVTVKKHVRKHVDGKNKK